MSRDAKMQGYQVGSAWMSQEGSDRINGDRINGLVISTNLKMVCVLG